MKARQSLAVLTPTGLSEFWDLLQSKVHYDSSLTIMVCAPSCPLGWPWWPLVALVALGLQTGVGSNKMKRDRFVALAKSISTPQRCRASWLIFYLRSESGNEMESFEQE